MHPSVVRVDHVPPDGERFEFVLTAEDLNVLLQERTLPDAMSAQSLRARVRVLPSGDDVFVLGDLQGEVRGECSRCLESFSQAVNGEFHLTFVRDLPTGSGGEVELHREDLDLDLLRGESIELGEVVAEQFLLLLPPRPLCRDACRGLCQVCGQNRNLEACACDDRVPDSRFAALSALCRDGEDTDT